MKVALVRPPSIINPLAYIGSLTPPIGLAYIAASVQKAGHSVTLIDSIGENFKQSVPIRGDLILRGLTFEQIIERIPPDTDVIGIGCMFSSEWTQIRRLVNQISEAFPDKLLVGGGEHFTAAPEISMKQCPGLSVCVLGEGEETFLELLDSVQKGVALDQVAGLILRKGDTFVRTATRARIRNIDEIPLPAWDLVNLETYLGNFLSYRG